MKQRYILLFAVTMLSLLVACSKTDIPSSETECDRIVFQPVLEKPSDSTKGEMITGTTYDYSKLGSFWVKVWNKDATSPQFGYTKVMQFKHESGSGHTYWSTVDSKDELVEYFWKKSETKYFYAYTNLPSTGATVAGINWYSQNLQYNLYQIPDAENQTDILLGLGKGVGYTKTDYVGRFVKITFSHPLTAIKFKRGTIEGWAEGDKITDIKIIGVYSSGKYYNNDTGSYWTPSSSTTVKMTDTSETFFLIPQNLATQNVTIKATVVIGGVTYSDVQATLNTGEWKAGNYYTYSLSFGAGSSLNLSVNLADWGKNNKDLEISSDFVLGYDPSVDPWSDADDTHLTYID